LRWDKNIVRDVTFRSSEGSVTASQPNLA